MVLFTLEQLEQLTLDHPRLGFQRDAKGKLIVAPPVGTLGGHGEAELIFQLESWARRDASGLAFAPDTGFTLPDGSVLAPDAAWISRERWNAVSSENRRGYARIAPDVVFELIPIGQGMSDTQVKAEAYLVNGVRLIVFLDARSRCVECRRQRGLTEHHARVDSVPLEPELPGFHLDAETIFRRLDG